MIFLSSRPWLPAALILMLAPLGCTNNDPNRPPISANTAPLPDRSLQPGLNSADTTNPITGAGRGVGPGPLSPGGFNGTGAGSAGGSLGGR